ncbi:Hypothetical Protein FCC1311_058682 [Hondaea fermentalgiana]|uniref:DUF2779 domain-containing protein n=1 Tax=Hondaea fermentalgiana TaxID=2315210 RepID=A0A2R5GFI6_9STRA|nr:Hypothetical Protein FCC1311_058682 [Hondaea fermentalgiana]|eukprot:GBG29647.1 Hypothetical Protein FCC1311_058682 [Hondaea fermentalgiana]
MEESASFPLAVGERLQRFVPTYFGPGVDLSSYRSMNKALAATYEALCDPDVQRIYEATFEVDGVLVRADVLERAPEDDYTWDLIEVKSSSSVREDHLMDLAVQSYVIRRDGSVDLRKASLASINGEFKLPKADPALADQERYKGLFTLTTLPLSPCSDEDGLPLSADESKTNEKTSDETRARFLAIKEEIAWMHEHILDEDAPCPEVEVGSHCNKPMDFETVQQIVPEGPIFVHSIAAERSVLKKLANHPSCKDIKEALRKVQSRMVCTLKLCKEHYYAPEQMGSFSLKAVVKGIPNSEVRYMDGGAVSNGQDAQIAWFIYNKENTSAKQREALAADLVRYCAKDTFALVELIEYLSLDDTAFVRARENSALGVRAQEAISSS